jgi:hypothetical protein
MTDKQIRKMADQYLRNDIKIIRHDTRIKKNRLIVARDSGLLILIIWTLFN